MEICQVSTYLYTHWYLWNYCGFGGLLLQRCKWWEQFSKKSVALSKVESEWKKHSTLLSKISVFSIKTNSGRAVHWSPLVKSMNVRSFRMRGQFLDDPNKNQQGCDRYEDFVHLNQIQNQIRLVLLVLADTIPLWENGKFCISEPDTDPNWVGSFGSARYTWRYVATLKISCTVGTIRM